MGHPERIISQREVFQTVSPPLAKVSDLCEKDYWENKMLKMHRILSPAVQDFHVSHSLLPGWTAAQTHPLHTYSRWVLSQFAMVLRSPLTIEYKPGLPKSLFQSGQQGES